MIRWAYLFVDRPYEDFGAACDFWARVAEARLSELRGERGEFTTLLPSGGDPCVKVQGVFDGPGGAHLDLAVDDVPHEARRARELGAGGVHTEPGLEVMRSPAGHLFCLVEWAGERTGPSAVSGTRIDQLSLDTPPSTYKAEAEFWAALTGWPEVPCESPEFRLLSAGRTVLPVQVLLQRLDTESVPSAHLDIACSERAAARAEHERLGATYVRDGRGWTVMRDPAGGLYCLTDRAP
ncbi:VOC family protein [Streptomyces sp. NPDC052225]|uniref:VOC family protein n=1 Tax=Streptomyces sp. NPDC052225 TaxID=3154949 RepID=UPI003433BD9F